MAKYVRVMLFLQGAQDILQQQGDSGRQGPKSLRHLGEEETGQSVGERRGSFSCRKGRGQQEKPWEGMKGKEKQVREKQGWG